MVLLAAIYDAEKNLCTRDHCDRFGLRFKAMQEIRKLRRQLANELSSLNVILDPRTLAPNQTEAFLLRQILLAGLSDQVAKRISPDELPEGADRKKFKNAYFSRTMEQPVFLKDFSVFKNNPPDFVVYQEIYEVKDKMIMRGVTAIDPEWLPEFCPLDCTLKQNLTRPPFYDSERDQILAYHNGTFGERGWDLPELKILHPNLPERVKYFAKYFLEGEIFPKLRSYTEEMSKKSVTPSAMISLRAKQAKSMFETLMNHEVDCKAKFVQILEENPKFLLKEYLQWLEEKYEKEVTKLWSELK